MIKSITVKRFKAVQNAHFDLHGTDILIGGNNSGKSSALQAIQFAVGILQTLKLNNNLNFKRGKDTLGTSLAPEQLVYSPIKDVNLLLFGADPLREGAGRSISIKIEKTDESGTNVAEITVSKGRNKNIAVSLKGAVLCQKIADVEHTFSMYVPGLAGIPFVEEFRPLGAVRRAVAKGDSNTILRNVLFQLQEKGDSNFTDFLSDIQTIFPDMRIRIDPRLDNDGVIEVFVTTGDYEKPIDAMGTGVLQIIQICAYVNLFNPQLLLLDEPDSHLHPSNQKLLAQTITSVAEKGCNILIATHSRHFGRGVAPNC